jgi:Xaa-Pro aminopeptidase
MPKPPTADEGRLVRDKQSQAIDFMKEKGIDVWITFVREGTEPILTSLITGCDYVVQNAALLFTSTGDRIALLEPIDVQNGVGTFFDEIVNFRNDITEPLRSAIGRLNPRNIALNYSVCEFAADGLTHGMYMRLVEALGPLGLREKMTSSEEIIIKIRAVKNDEEIERIRKAIEVISAIADDVTARVKGRVTNAELMDFVSSRAGHYGCTRASASIAVNPVGEAFKGVRDRPIQPGDLLCSDMGATYKGYCSDIKRCWYVLKPGETGIPDLLRRQWEACQSALELSRRASVPGAWGYEVHDLAWAEMRRYGYSYDHHSWGHQIGRRAHDAGVWLGDRANRFRPSESRLEENMVVTLDPTINRVKVNDPGVFSMGMEEIAVVKPGGASYLFPPPKEIVCVRL